MGETPQKVMLLSLGCDKNLVDSEMMLGSLAEAGYTLTDAAEEADAVVVNTCSFIQDAKEEGSAIDLCQGKKGRSIVILDNGMVVLSSFEMDKIEARLRGEGD